MENNNSSHITKIPFKFNSIEKQTTLIPIKTIQNYSCFTLTNQIIIYDLIKNGNNLDNELVFANNIISINKITMDNKNYLYFILGNKNELYLIEKNENLKNVEIASFKPFENEKINKIIILDNKNIVAAVDGIKLSYYEYKNEQYTKLFNNINKFNAIYELNKFQNNSYYFLTFNENLNIEMILFNEDFTSIEKEINVKRPIRTFRNNKLFKINNNRVVIIGNKEFIVFNLISFEVQTIFNTGLICCALPFNNIPTEKDYYDYLALIIFEEDQFYLQIFRLLSNDTIDEINKINLNEYSSEFEALIDDNEFLNIFKEDDKMNKDKEGLMFPFHNIIINKLNLISNSNKDIYFDMVYDLNSDGKVVLIISLIRSWGNKKLTIMLNIDLKNLHFA